MSKPQFRHYKRAVRYVKRAEKIGSLRRKWNAWKYDRRERSNQRIYSRYMRKRGWSKGLECYKCGRIGHVAVACRSC